MDDEERYLVHIEKLDPPEIETLVRKYWHDVWQYAYFLTRRTHTADDITQETFIRAFRSVGSFRGQCAVKTWLFKIARNTAFNWRRSAFFRRAIPSGLLRDERSAPSAEDAYWSAADMDELWREVLRLPRIYREILLLETQSGLSRDEYAAMLGISPGTVKTRLHRARKLLDKKWRSAGREVDDHAE